MRTALCKHGYGGRTRAGVRKAMVIGPSMTGLSMIVLSVTGANIIGRDMIGLSKASLSMIGRNRIGLDMLRGGHRCASTDRGEQNQCQRGEIEKVGPNKIILSITGLCVNGLNTISLNMIRLRMIGLSVISPSVIGPSMNDLSMIDICMTKLSTIDL